MYPSDYFLNYTSTTHKQYEALRMFFIEGRSASYVSKQFGYTYRGFTTIVCDFREKCKYNPQSDLFFQERKKGRKTTDPVNMSKELIIELRKKYYSVEDIKGILDGKGYKISEKTIYNVIKAEGFARLPRRQKLVKHQLHTPSIKADQSEALNFEKEEFKSRSSGILCLLPYIEKYGIREIIEKSGYPETNVINKLSSILSFVALKGSNVRRYTADNMWCMDRGLGLFAGLNVLPKSAWFTSYSHRVTSAMNRQFLKSLHAVWVKNDLLNDTINMDFTTIPYWGEDKHLENNWSGKRGKALSSILAVLAQDPDTGIIDFGNTNVMHKNESKVVLEFLDFYKEASSGEKINLQYLVFDSKFTTYQNLSKLDDEQVKFLTIRRRSKGIIDRINNIPKTDFKTIRVMAAGNKKRTLKVYEEDVFIKGYNKNIRQVIITGNGKIKPALIITNDYNLTLEQIVRKYARRWIIEKTISEQIEFFHLNNVSSSMVIKVDFDLTMSILTYNIYRLFALDLERYSNLNIQSLHEKFLDNSADVKIENDKIIVALKKKRNLPLILDAMEKFQNKKYRAFKNKKLIFSGASYS